MPIRQTSTSAGLSRRSLLAMMGAGGAAAALSGIFPTGTARAAGTVNIYSWPDYFAQEDLDAFTKQTGIAVNITTYNADETMFAKLNSPAGSGFDIVVPSSGWIQQLAAKNLIQPLDHTKIDFSALDQSLLNKDYDPGNKYTIPKDWGLLGVVYDPAAVGGEIKTWQDFIDAGSKPNVTGKIRMTTSATETVGPALWIAGKNWNTATEDEIREAGKVMIDFAKNVKTFAAFDPAAMASGAIVMAQANQSAARNAILQNPKLKWVVPGPHSEIWVDSYAIAAGAPNEENAYKFLNFFLSPEVQVKETSYIGYPAAIAGLQAKMPGDLKESELIFGGANVDFSALTAYVVNPATAAVYQDIQSQVQAAAGA